MANTSFRSFNAHETSAVDELAIVIGCGDAEFKVIRSFRSVTSILTNC